MSTHVDLIVPAPAAPCSDCVNNSPIRSDQDATVGIVWCPHNRYGGVYRVEVGTWEIYGPFASEDEFHRALAARISGAVAVATLLQKHTPAS